jgi:DNA-directed RNA polymerase specialized sigma24 family protein
MAETERKLACGALAGDVRAFRELYEVAFRVAWAFALRSCGEAPLAEALTAGTLRRAFADLAPLADGRQGLGSLVLRCAGDALRELRPDRPADPAVGASDAE